MKPIVQSFVFISLLCVSGLTLSDEDNKIAYMMYTGSNWQVYILDVNTGKSKQVSAVSYDVSTVSWLNDGMHVFICGIQAQAEIINVSNGDSRKIKLPFDTINDAVISPDGSKLVFSYINPGSINNKLWVMDINSNTMRPILKDLEGRQYDPKWSKDGSEIYFVSGVAGGAYGIAKYSLSSKKATKLITNAFYNLDVDINNNGDIAYSSNISGNFDIWTDDGVTRKRITSDTGTQTHPGWSVDSDHIYYESVKDGISNIWSADLSAAESSAAHKQLTFSQHGARYPAVYRGAK